MSFPEPDHLQISRDRIVQVFEYLKALNEHRNPAKRHLKEQPWSQWLDDLPNHPAIILGVWREDSEAEESSPLEHEDFVLKVRRPKLTPAPPPPDEIRPWLRSGWELPENPEVGCTDSKSELDDNGETISIRFEDDPARTEALDRWKKERNQWVVNEIPARRAMKVFERLYELHGRMEREAERLDLVLGDGILSWRREDGSILHPVLIQRVQLVFNPKVPEFTVADADYGVELYTSPFQSMSDVEPESLANCRNELEQGNYHPLADGTSAFLARFAVALSSHGEFSGKGRPSEEHEHPRIGRAPVLFLRSRTLGFGTAIERVLENVRGRTKFNTALQNVVGVEAAPSWDDEPAEPSARSHLRVADGDILFGKEANPEQIRIAQRLEKYGSVLVQGPPGTGKSHTIANLVGHLLAQNKSVLVTSHTTKALRVLRQHVVSELRPLCVSVLESDLDSRRQLEDSVQAISSRLSDADADALEEEANRLGEERRQLIARLDNLQTELLNARTAEYRDVVFGGKSMSPSQAARKVAEGRGQYDWIPGPVAPGEPLPLSPGELIKLYATNSETTPDDDMHVDSPLPTHDALLSPDEFEETVRASDELADQARTHNNEYWNRVKLTTNHLRQLELLVTELKRAVSEIRSMEPWQLAAVDAGRSGNADRAPWDHLLGKVDETIRFVADAQIDGVKYAPEISTNESLEEQRQLAEGIATRLRSGGQLSWTTLMIKPSWKRAVRSWRVRGGTPNKREHFVAIEKALAARLSKEDLAILWDGLMAENGCTRSAELGKQMEQVCGQYVDMIRNATEWWNKRWVPMIEGLRQLGFDWDRFVSKQPPSLKKHGAMLRVIDGVDHELLQSLTDTANYLRSLHLRTQLRTSSEKLAEFDRPEVHDIRRAIEQSDITGYRQAHTQLISAINRQQCARRRRELLLRLERHASSGTTVAESWASQIQNRIDVHGQRDMPSDPVLAWEWRQLNDELDRRNQVDLEVLNEQIENVRRRLTETTNQLIDRLAWAGQVRRTSLSQRQALIGWLDTVRRIGRGYSKRAPLLRLEARKKMTACRGAVPVWIMPLARLVENFDFHETEFDVVIIDEASQCDVMALLAFAIAKQVIVVGDHEQVSPSAVGQKTDVVDNLIRLHLQGIPNSDLYDGRMSVYDLARQSFGGTICLLEHFRCVPDIIQFSNYLSYHGTIKPLRDESSSRLQRHVIPYRVEASNSAGKVNREEAMAIASLVVAAIEDPTYDNQSFGVVSMVGDEQALEIERLLRKHLPPEQFESRRIVCGNSAHFQGDERDVMFLSIVDAPRGGPLPLRQQPAFQQRFNVAASRAKNQMWVVYSVSPDTDFKPGDLRRRLIEHALDPKAITRELEQAERRAESEFERQVMKRLVATRYKVTPQWRVGRYRIDMVVEGAQRRLAVECDGDRYHPIEKLPDDLARQAILERLGWTFHRIRGSEFFRDPDHVIERLFAKLSAMGIEPAGGGSASTDDSYSDTDAIERRAAELRTAWMASESDIMFSNEDQVAGEDEIQVDDGQRMLFDTDWSGLATHGVANGEDSHRTVSLELPQSSASETTEDRDHAQEQFPAAPADDSSIGRAVSKAKTVQDAMFGELSPKITENVPATDADAETWFALAHWAKKHDKLTSWERQFAFSQGIRVNKGTRPSEKQAKVCERILREARALGFQGPE